MKKLALVTIAASFCLYASPAVSGGITYKFGGSDKPEENIGATVKVLSSSEAKKPVIGAGLSYYPMASSDKKLGLDVSAGYNFEKGAVMAGWDFLQNQASASVGYNKEIKADTKTDDEIQDARCNKGK